MDTLLVVNAGSSSVKFQVFRVDNKGEPTRHIVGQVDGIGVKPRLRCKSIDGSITVDRSFNPNEAKDVQSAMQAAAQWLQSQLGSMPDAIGHRVVHGGPEFNRPVLINEAVLASLEKYVSLAPLHQPNNLAPIKSIHSRFPNLPQVACFDTAFHRGHSAVADHYAIPQSLYKEGVRRYGFHGLSYEYISSVLPQVAPARADGRIIVAHLGSGSSMCALRDGRSTESTMGFTALDGLPMGTRPGEIDPGIILYLINQNGMSAAEVQNFLYRECGLKGLSSVSNDVRDLLASKDPQAQFALEHWVYRIMLHTGMLVAALGGLDAFVFTAGVGENSPQIREQIGKSLGWLGVVIDRAANNSRDPTLISATRSKISVYVVRTDEELIIARHTLSVVGQVNPQRMVRTLA
jgi:acetate kinase